MKKVDLILLLLIVFISFLLGSRMILSGDFYYLFDQARDYLLAKDILEVNRFVLIGTHSGLGGFFHGPLWLYMITPVYIIGQGDPMSFAYFYIFLQIVTVIASFTCGKKLYGTRGGLIISLLIALSPGIWSHVPNTIGVNMLPLVFLGLFYFLIKFIRGDQNAFIFAAFFAGLSLQFEAALPLVLIPAMAIIFTTNKIAIKNVRVILLSVFSYIVSIATFILFDLRHQFLMSKSIFGALSGGRREKGYLDWNSRIYEHFDSLLGVYKSILFKDDFVFSILLASILIFGAYNIYKNKKNKYRKEFLFLFLFPVIIFGLFIFYPYKIWPEYVLGLTVPVAVIFYLSLTTIWKSTFGKIMTGLFFAIVTFYLFNNLSILYFQEYPESKSAGSYKNQKDVVDWIYKDRRNGELGYFVYTPETYTHGMDYLISQMGKKYPKIKAKNTKQEITYLILYPHLADDQKAHDFWKKNVVRTNGKVIYSKVFRGNIKVEKLLIENKEPSADPNYYQGLIFR